MVPLSELIHFSLPIRPITGFRLWHHNVTLGTTTILKHWYVVWCKSLRYLEPFGRGTLVWWTDWRRDRRTDEIVITIAARHTYANKGVALPALCASALRLSMGRVINVLLCRPIACFCSVVRCFCRQRQFNRLHGKTQTELNVFSVVQETGS